jgi:hypothetical protein
MWVGRRFAVTIAVLAFLVLVPATLKSTPRKAHVVALGAIRRVPYSKTGDPAPHRAKMPFESDPLSLMAPSRNGPPANRTT